MTRVLAYMMTAFTIYSLLAFAIAYVIGHSELTRVPREFVFGDPAVRTPGLVVRRLFVSLIECFGCFGFWIGFVAALIGMTPVLLSETPFWNAVIWGGLTLSTNLVLAGLAQLNHK